MTEITIRLDNPALFERVAKFLLRWNIAFHVQPDAQQEDPFAEVARTGRNKTWSEDPQTRTIQSRLHAKYVVTGEWDKMDDEDRQDAVLGEMMVYNTEQPDYEVYSVENTAQFLTDLKKGLYANTGQQAIS